MAVAGFRQSISNEELRRVPELKSFHDYVIDGMSHKFAKLIKEKMEISSRDLDYMDAIEVEAKVVIMSVSEYEELTGRKV